MLAALPVPSPGFVLTPARRRRHTQRLKRQGLLPAWQEQLRNADRLLGLRRLGRLDAAELREVAEQEAPNKTDQAAWPTDIAELADTIQRQAIIYRDGRPVNPGNLNPGEEAVRDRDRQMLVKGLPPGIEVNRDDPFYTQ